MITREWTDFVVNPSGPITNKMDRFNLDKPGGKVVKREIFERGTEKIEAIEIEELGGITIWTTTKVWCIRNEGVREKLIYLPRNPPDEK